MRSLTVATFLLASAALSACTSSAGFDALQPTPSMETTSSVTRPSVAMGDRAKIAEPMRMPSQAEAEVAEEVKDAAITSLTEELSAPDPLVETAALLTPPPPEARPERAARTERGNVTRHRFKDAKPINFGKKSPRDHAVHGVDISRWQGDIDWQKLRSQGANFVYIKATDGGDHLDPMFKKNWREAEQAGLKRGAYHFFYWCRTAGEQADWFIRNVPRVAGALPPVIDVEWNGQSRCRKQPSRAKVLEKMQVFMDKLEAHYGQRPVIYTAPDFYADNLRGAFEGYPFWLRAVAQHPSKVYPGRKWVFWQYSGSGLSQGVKGRIDLNVFHGSEQEWFRWTDRQDRMALN